MAVECHYLSIESIYLKSFWEPRSNPLFYRPNYGDSNYLTKNFENSQLSTISNITFSINTCRNCTNWLEIHYKVCYTIFQLHSIWVHSLLSTKTDENIYWSFFFKKFWQYYIARSLMKLLNKLFSATKTLSFAKTG